VQFTTRVVCDLLRYDYSISVQFTTREVCDLLRYDYGVEIAFECTCQFPSPFKRPANV